MLSEKGAEILLLIKNEDYGEILDFNTFSYLKEKGYIQYSQDKTSYLSPLGEEVLDDYLYTQNLKQIAENANSIAENANSIAKKSNHKANVSNLIAIFSLITAILVAIFK